MPAQGDGAAPVHDVLMAGLPVSLVERSSEWFESLVREFDIIASDGDGEGPPRRLVDFVHVVRHRFGRFSSQSDAPFAQARAEGREEFDVVMTLPTVAADAATELLDHIREAVSFCEQGDLLTLAPPDDVLRFATWYLAEVASQIGGGRATAWPAAGRSADDAGAGTG